MYECKFLRAWLLCPASAVYEKDSLKGCLHLENQANQGMVVPTALEMVPWRQVLTMIEADGRKNINHKELICLLNTVI